MEDEKRRLYDLTIEKDIYNLAKTVLYDLNRWEFDDLANRDPSFESVLKDMRQALLILDVLGHSKLVTIAREIFDILESTAQSIVERNVQLLVDNTTHLQEFVEIRENGGINHEDRA